MVNSRSLWVLSGAAQVDAQGSDLTCSQELVIEKYQHHLFGTVDKYN